MVVILKGLFCTHGQLGMINSRVSEIGFKVVSVEHEFRASQPEEKSCSIVGDTSASTSAG